MCLNIFSTIAVIISSNLKSGNDCLSPSLICWRIRFQSPTDIVIRALTRTSSALSMDIDASYRLGALIISFPPPTSPNNQNHDARHFVIDYCSRSILASVEKLVASTGVVSCPLCRLLRPGFSLRFRLRWLCRFSLFLRILFLHGSHTVGTDVAVLFRELCRPMTSIET